MRSFWPDLNLQYRKTGKLDYKLGNIEKMMIIGYLNLIKILFNFSRDTMRSMKKVEIVFYLLTIIIYILCIILFCFTMVDVWTKYTSKLTTTGSHYKEHSEDKKLLPCVTLHSISAFKTRGFHYTKQAIMNNSYSAGEVFDPIFLNILRNSSQYWMKEYYSIYFGTCFTICYLEKVPARKYVNLQEDE